MVHWYKYYVFGHFPSSYLYPKTLSCLFFKAQRFGDWILSKSSNKMIHRMVFLDKDRAMETVQKHNICIKIHLMEVRQK
jgi:hypothetical protein